MPLDDGTELWAITRPYAIRLLKIAWDDAQDAGFVDAAFDLALPEVQEVLQVLAQRIKGVTDTTRERVRELVGEGAREGWGVEELARRMDESGLFSLQRAELVSRTETATAYSRGSLLAWQRSGQVDRVEWLTTQPCPEICDALSGQIVPIGQPFANGIEHPPAHPNCRCALAPVLSEAA